MNKQQNACTKGWPVVPIFRRRKRPRQAFYAEPSAALGNKIEKENVLQDFNGKCKQTSQLTATYEVLGIADDKIGDDFDDNISEEFLENENICHYEEPEEPSFTFRKQSHEVTSARKSSSNPMQMINNGPNTQRNVNLANKNSRSYAPELAKMQNKERTWEKVQRQDSKVTEQQPIHSMQSKSPKSPHISKAPTVPRILTVSSKDIKEIIGYKDMMPALYEIYGFLDSAVTSMNTSGGKKFHIKDATGNMKCIFWEIDRPFPMIRRGASIRCVGRIANDQFQCLSIRGATQEEIRLSKNLLKKSQNYIHQYVVTKPEY